MFKAVYSLILLSFMAIGASAFSPNATRAQPMYSSGPQCFRTSNISEFVAGPQGVLMVRAEGARWFQLHLTPGCPDFRTIRAIGVRPKDSGWLCSGQHAELGGLPSGQSARCFVDDVRELPPGMTPG